MVALDASEIPQKVNAAASAILEAVAPWYESHRKNGSIDSNVMCAGLYITEFLVSAFPLERELYAARSQSQVKGASGAKAKALLADHGENRRFTSEGGRTSRFTIRHAENLAAVINEAGKSQGVERFSNDERRALAYLLQKWFVGRVQEDYFERKRISAEINPDYSIRTTVANLIAAGRERGGTTAGAIAQHLVGAKLQIRFPSEEINLESYTTADVQTGRHGDYQVGDTAIHVTMSPNENLFRGRCRHNIDHGFRPRVLVPENSLAAAVQLASISDLAEHVAVQSIEDFVGTNIEEVAGFSSDKIRVQLRNLLETYNQRVQLAEADQSLQIEIPENL